MEKHQILCAVVTIVVLFCTGFSAKAEDNKPYYGFYSSSLGSEYKRLEHNILSFSIDIPSNWTFGVHGSGATTVALLYPESLDISKLTNFYETVEIGVLPFANISLSKAYEYILLGMKEHHPNLVIEEEVKESPVGKLSALEFLYSWESKNGSVIKEWVHLISYKGQIRSLTIRVVEDKLSSQRDLYRKIIQSYNPF